MNARKQCLTLVLALTVLLAACNKKSTDEAGSQNPPASAPPTSDQANSSAPAPSPTQGETPQANPVPPATPVGVASSTPPPEPPPKPKPIVVPAGTVLTVRLQQGLSSKTNAQGDPFDATLAQPLSVNGKVVAQAGCSVSGTVTEAHKAGRFKGGATLDIALSSITIKSQKFEIATMTMSQTSKGKGKRTAVMAGGSAGAGALIGGLAGGGKGAAIGALLGAGAGTAGAGLTGNRDISLPAESAVSFQMTRALTLPGKSSENSEER